jgi:cysteinyl-tRNA synthetase
MTNQTEAPGERMDDQKSREIAQALSAASEQIGLALQDSQPQVDTLGQSLARVAELLSSDLSDPAAVAELKALRREMARAVTGLQFYDRMAQHLTHVRDYLAASSEQLGSAGGAPPASWDGLNRRLADKLLSDTHRMYLGKNFSAEFLAGRANASRAERGAASPGDIDLF